MMDGQIAAISSNASPSSAGNNQPAGGGKMSGKRLSAAAKSVKFTDQQRQRMEDIYSRTPYPPTEEKQRLADDIGLKYDQVLRD